MQGIVFALKDNITIAIEGKYEKTTTRIRNNNKLESEKLDKRIVQASPPSWRQPQTFREDCSR